MTIYSLAAPAAKSLQSCPTLCDPMDCRPTRLLHPWDFPGKSTGAGCHFLLQCMKVKSESEVAQSCPTPSNPMDCRPTRILCPWDFPGKSTGVSCHVLLHIALTYSFSYLEPICCSMSSSGCCFLTCIQISQEAGKVVWYSHLFKSFPQFVVIHTVKGFGIVNKTEVDVFLELSCFLSDPTDDGNLISGSSAFKSSLNIWKFTVHILLKAGLENFEHLLAFEMSAFVW